VDNTSVPHILHSVAIFFQFRMFLGLIDNGAVVVVTVRNCCICYVYVVDGFVRCNYIWSVVMDWS
jgi:hypothetical protein